MKDYSDLKVFNDKKLRTIRNNINNRLVSFKSNSEKSLKALPPSHMLHGLDEAQCKALLERVFKELKTRG
ncbi:MAG: hypothetical protein H0V66_15750 [Bdellovibrionales bacterium]|nr:hypothetical protein [Bdellovibrionales bacterium]